MWWRLVLLVALSVSLAEPVAAQFTFPPTCGEAAPNVTNDYTDVKYGGKVRQFYRPGKVEHNLYHYRNPWNADNSYMVSVWEDLPPPGGAVGANSRLVLLNGTTGCYIKDIFNPLSVGDWQITWDKNDPDLFYYKKSPRLYRYHVSTGVSDELVNVSPRQINQWPTLNGDGTRIFTITVSAPTKYETWELPNMTNHREFVPAVPSGCDQRHTQYTGYQNNIATECRNGNQTVPPFPGGIIYSDDGTVIHNSVEAIEHSDFGPGGQWAYAHVDNGSYDFFLKNQDGTNDHFLFNVTGKAQNMHITWPKKEPGWFLVAFFSRNSSNPPLTTPFDEVMKVNIDGTHSYLARTFSTDAWNSYFWAQAQISVTNNGSMAMWNNYCFPAYDTPGECLSSGQENEVDSNILYIGEPVIEPPTGPPSLKGKIGVKGKVTVK